MLLVNNQNRHNPAVSKASLPHVRFQEAAMIQSHRHNSTLMEFERLTEGDAIWMSRQLALLHVMEGNTLYLWGNQG